MSSKEARLREIQSVQCNTWRALPYLQTLERLIICIETSKIDDGTPANGIDSTLAKMVLQNDWEEMTTTTLHGLGRRPDIKVVFEYEYV